MRRNKLALQKLFFQKKIKKIMRIIQGFSVKKMRKNTKTC